MIVMLSAGATIDDFSIIGAHVSAHGGVYTNISDLWLNANGADSGLRFKTIGADLKKPGVLPWLLLPTVSGIITLIVGNLIFSGEFAAHVMGRTESNLSFDKMALLVGQVFL